MDDWNDTSIVCPHCGESYLYPERIERYVPSGVFGYGHTERSFVCPHCKRDRDGRQAS